MGTLLLAGCASLPYYQENQVNARYEFALIGDAPYNDFDATHSFPNLVQELNRNRLAFVVHDGDIKGGSDPITDQILLDRHRLFQTIRHPFILIFGDNEWTDAAKARKGAPPDPIYDPENRLERLREVFAAGDHSLGQRHLRLTRQSTHPEFADYRENVRWSYGHVTYVGLNITGSGNHHGTEEFNRRNRANLAWLKDAFDHARQARHRALMIIIQANPKFEAAARDPARAGFNDFLKVLEEETVAFAKPVVLVHGDSHYFRIDKPMVHSRSGRRVEHFTRVETFGNPDIHWIRARVDWRDPAVFTFRPQIIEANRVTHQ